MKNNKKKKKTPRKRDFPKGGNDIPCTLHEITEPFILNKKPFPTPYNFCQSQLFTKLPLFIAVYSRTGVIWFNFDGAIFEQN